MASFGAESSEVIVQIGDIKNHPSNNRWCVECVFTHTVHPEQNKVSLNHIWYFMLQ